MKKGTVLSYQIISISFIVLFKGLLKIVWDKIPKFLKYQQFSGNFYNYNLREHIKKNTLADSSAKEGGGMVRPPRRKKCIFFHKILRNCFECSETKEYTKKGRFVQGYPVKSSKFFKIFSYNIEMKVFFLQNQSFVFFRNHPFQAFLV